ncbi:MAG: hypothetical protein Kow0076_5180 [Francisella sp.]
MKTKSFLLLILCGVVSSCATLSGGYPSKVYNAKQSIENCQYKDVANTFLQSFNDNGIDASIGYLESGRFAQLIGNIDVSQQRYNKATDYVAKSEAEAKIRVRNILKDAQATLLSDKERYYYIPDYEITFLYAYQALNYLKNNDLENAAVSIRNLSYAQYATFQSKELAKEQNYQNNDKVDTQKISSNISSSKEYKQLESIANKVSNSYENAFGYYLESIIYQAYDTDLNNAHLSMSNAFRMVPNNPYVKADYQQMRKAFYDGGSIYSQGYGKLVVIYESGWVEPIKKFDLPITIFFNQAGIQKISLPYYSDYSLEPSADIKIFKEKDLVAQGKSALLVDTTAMAAKSLSDKYPSIIAREILRLVTKTAVSVAAIKSSGDYAALSAIGTSIYNLATTQADQRSWNLLPKNVELFSKDLYAGNYTLKINDTTVNITLKPQKVTLVWFVKEGSYKQVLLNQSL